MANFVPQFSFGVSILVMMTILFVFVIFHKAIHRLNKPLVRLPNGDLSNT